MSSNNGGGSSNLNFDERRGTLGGVVRMKYGRLHHISNKFRLRYAVLNVMDGSFAFYSIDHHHHSSSSGGTRATVSRNLVLLLPHGSWSMYGGPFDDDVVGDGDNEGDGGDAAASTATRYLEIVYSNYFQKRRRRRGGRCGGRDDHDNDSDDGGKAAAAFPSNVSPDRRDFGRRYRRGFRRISLRCASVAERGSWIDAAERVHARGGSSRSLVRVSSSGDAVAGGAGARDAGAGGAKAGVVAVGATAAPAEDDPINARPRRGVRRKVRGLRLRRLKSRRCRTTAPAAQHLVGGGDLVERSTEVEGGRHLSSSRLMEALPSHGRRDTDIDEADEESNGNNRSSYSVFDGDDDEDMDEEDEAENADFFGMDDHPYGIIAPQHHRLEGGDNGSGESDGEEDDESPGLLGGGAFIAPAPKIFRASSEPPIGTTFQSSDNASSVPHGGNDDDDGGTAGVHSCRSSPGALYRPGSPRRAKSKMQRYKKVKPHHAYPATYMMEEEIAAEMMKPSDRYEDLCRYDYSSLQQITSSGRPSQIGRLQVEVLSCIGLPKFDRFSKTDTTVYLLCGESAFATDVIPSCLCPMWPQRSRRAVRIPLFHAYARLFVGVFGVNSNEKENDHFVGRAVIDLATLRPGTEYDATLGLGLSSYAYDRRPRGAVRLRFHLDWSDERAAVLSYLRRCPTAVENGIGRGCGGVAGVTIPCSDAKTFRNVAITLHGNNLPGKFSRRNFRATRREFVLYHIQTSALVKRIIRNIISWKDPRVSAYVFLGWMHCVYSSSVAMALSYLLGFLIILFVKNYLRYNVHGEACAHGYAPLTFTELLLSLLLGGSCSKRHFMRPASMKTSDRTTTTASERTLSDGSETQDGDILFMDPDSLDHMEFPFSERNLYPKRSVKENLVPRVRSNTSDKLSSGQKRLLSTTASSQMHSPLFDRNDSDLSDDDELSDAEDDSAVSDLHDEEMIDDLSQLQTSTNSGTLIPAGPNQNVDILPKKRVPPKVHLLKFENWIHNTTGRIFDEKVTGSTISSRTKAARDNSSETAAQADDQSPEHSDDKDVNLVPAIPAVDVALLGSGYLGQVLQAAPILVRQATRYLPMQAPILTSPLSSWMFNPTLRLYEDQKCRMISHPSTNSTTAQQGKACHDGSVSGKKSKRSIDEFDRRLGLHRQRPNPVAALSADYLGPIMRIMQIYSCAVRIVFNAFAWKDPFLSFWILIFLIGATSLSIIFPWRNFFFVVGLVGLGPQNLILLAVSKKKIERQAMQQSATMSSSDCVKDRRIDDSDVCGASTRVGTKGSEPGQRCDDANSSKKTGTFSRLARRRPTVLRRNRSATPSSNTNNGAAEESKLPPPFSGRPIKSALKKGKKQASPREVIVPYTPLRKERFYYWPPDPSASGITVMASGTFSVDS